ncbi:MAG TPA: DUF3098 domain-containing protein [Bacteroidia bacterium]|nr:DUF3098 domain-containing protein [Bacteroidia bacterium]
MAKKIEIKKTAPGKGSVQSEKKADKTFIANNTNFAFGRDNYMFILAGVGVLVIGYLLMVGGGSDTPDKFNPEIFSTRRITIAPVTLLIGFGIVLYGIMKKPKQAE